MCSLARTQARTSGTVATLTAKIGRPVPAPFTASGKALLAAKAEMERRLAGWAARGAAPRPGGQIGRDDEEALPGIACTGMALPTSQRPGDQVGISLSAAAGRLTERRRRAIGAELGWLAEALGARL